MINPVTLTLTVVAAAAVGYLAGVYARRNLDQLDYRQADEKQQPKPAPRQWVPSVTAAALATLTTAAMLSRQPILMLPMVPLTLTGSWLAAVDLDVYRLPNRVTGPVAVATLTAVAMAATVAGEPSIALLALTGSILAASVFGLSHLLTRGGIGMGDVKLATISGLAIGPTGPIPVTAALMIGSAAAIIWTKATKHSGPMAYGPWLLIGAWAAAPLAALVS